MGLSEHIASGSASTLRAAGLRRLSSSRVSLSIACHSSNCLRRTKLRRPSGEAQGKNSGTRWHGSIRILPRSLPERLSRWPVHSSCAPWRKRKCRDPDRIPAVKGGKRQLRALPLLSSLRPDPPAAGRSLLNDLSYRLRCRSCGKSYVAGAHFAHGTHDGATNRRLPSGEVFTPDRCPICPRAGR